MAIHQTKKQSDLEKRLRLLRQQVYGKGSEELRKTQQNQQVSRPENLTLQYTDTPILSDAPSRSVPTQSGYLSFRSDITYLHQDLTKIFLLAGVALGAQIILFYLVQHNILRINLL